MAPQHSGTDPRPATSPAQATSIPPNAGPAGVVGAGTERPAGEGELPKMYRPAEHEDRIFDRWQASGAFHADPQRVLSGEAEPYCILIPPPNVTDRLHLGHALNNSLQDILTRAHRMMGFETMWMPGTDHAGIATQAVVERRLKKEEGKTRQQLGREAFVAKVQAFKDEYEATITNQLKKMGCSCDWERQRFTMDPICARAVREAFFRLFKDGLIYRGKRLVNWDPVLQTAIADDEIENIEVDGHFYYLRYPLVHAHGAPTAQERSQHLPAPDDAVPVSWSELARRGYPGADAQPSEEQAYVTVATTRPETYLGDTAVAVNPHDPRAKPLRGLSVELPLVGRVIPIIEDEYVVLPSAAGEYGRALNLRETDQPEDPKAAFATGFLKVTPAHDPNDYELGRKHSLPVINVMAPDATISGTHGWSDPRELANAHVFIGKKREEARKLVVKEFDARGLLEAQKPYRHTVGHSDRSKAAVEPYLSDQWYVRVTDPRLAASANAALTPAQRTHSPAARGAASFHTAGNVIRPTGNITRPAGSAVPPTGNPPPTTGNTLLTSGNVLHERGNTFPPSGNKAGTARGAAGRVATAQAEGDGALTFHPARYAKTYENWHDNIRDWCISRQLWWGHRIPVWHRRMTIQKGDYAEAGEIGALGLDHLIHGEYSGGVLRAHNSDGAEIDPREILQVDRTADRTFDIFVCYDGRDPLDAKRLEERDSGDFVQDPDVLDTWFSSALWPMSTMHWPDETDLLKAFNPTSTLCTAREIITLWVSRMVMFNRYFRGQDLSAGAGHGPVPFRDVFIHAMIQDGEGRKMSKSLGNGVDPLDIIATHGADAMRFTLCHMTTQTQDVRMPVVKDAAGKNTSPKFDLGRNFANKLWNASRFTLGILHAHEAPGAPAAPGPAANGHAVRSTLSLPDRWMLSRLATAVAEVEASLGEFQFSSYASTMYDLLWRDFCDWYLEAIKPTVASDSRQRAVLAATLDVIVRLLHPIMPFVTEVIFEHTRAAAGAVPGVQLGTPRKGELLCTAPWPTVDAALKDPAAEAEFEHLRGLITAIREVRAQHQVQPKRKITLHVPKPRLAKLQTSQLLVATLAGLEEITDQPAPPGGKSVAFAFDAAEFTLGNLADEVDSGSEAARLTRLTADLDKSISTLESRLANPGYALKAPPNMVQQTKDQLDKAKAQRSAAAAALEKLG